jgi:hypothetical protein
MVLTLLLSVRHASAAQMEEKKDTRVNFVFRTVQSALPGAFVSCVRRKKAVNGRA